MTLVRYGQAAIIAAILTLAGNAVWAQESKPQYDCQKNYPTLICADKAACCKDGKCCKDGDGCCTSKKCEAKCTSCKDSKCSACKGGECCSDNNGKYSCGKDKTSSTKTGYGCCPIMSKLAKGTAIIMVMPASMPLPPCCIEMMGMMPHPPMPPGPHMFLPPMMPPISPILATVMPPMMPPIPMPHPVNAHEANTGSSIFGVGVNCNTGLVGSFSSAGTPTVVPCASTTPTTAAKICIIATMLGYDNVLEMSVGDESCIRCKKMMVKIGDNEIVVSHFVDRVRVRGEQLKATANCVRTDGKDRLILEGDVVLHYKKDGHSAHVTGEHIELNLSNSAMTIQQAAKAPTVGISAVIHESK